MSTQAQRILVGFDGTDGSHRALAAATRLVGYGSRITVVGVGNDADKTGLTLDDARQRLLEQLVTANYVLRTGDPAEELLGAARELDADLIVVGRHRPFEGSAARVGSVSASVVRDAPCDVLVVR